MRSDRGYEDRRILARSTLASGLTFCPPFLTPQNGRQVNLLLTGKQKGASPNGTHPDLWKFAATQERRGVLESIGEPTLESVKRSHITKTEIIVCLDRIDEVLCRDRVKPRTDHVAGRKT